jgi:hypothetical protein
MSTRVYTPPTGMQAAFPRCPFPELASGVPWTAASEGASRGTTMRGGPLPGWRLVPSPAPRDSDSSRPGCCAPGKAAAHSAADQIAVLVEAPGQLPVHRYSGRTSARVC